ncbi:CPBP family intramembrane glutamic endopeptidase [Planococcus shixiaomingii]|uniref:CPBP family intramembrane glutamic endopeptidase n=1 Tax=Planococcus shixiaomingii TaxID=3058393 RepID=UPI00263764BD|nr:type II CAAX endopeptidase family protein [Planococcus sp. N022]WKA55524.1 type II CAAX endopeptidase family protein [Planococcus sp. N022]
MFEEMRTRFVIGLMTVVSIVSVSLLLQATGNVLLNSLFAMLVFYIVLPVGICSYSFNKRGVKLRQVVFYRGTARWLLPVFGLTVLVTASSISLYWLLLRGLLSLSPTVVDSLLTQRQLPDALWYLVAIGFILAVIAPIAEEFVFREVLLNQLMAIFGLWKGISLTSLIFAIFHFNIFGSFLFAVVASLLYVKTGNLLLPILLHIFNNTFSVYQTFVNPSFLEWLMVKDINDLYAKAGANLIMLIVSVGLLIFISLWMGRNLETRQQSIK